jgi:flagellar biosynthesis/type III secretory pathway M-ring protein FliF/YscJ
VQQEQPRGSVPGTGSNTGVAVYPTANPTQSDASLSTYSTEFLNNQLKEQISRDGYEIKDISVAIVIGNKTLTQEEILQYRQLAAFASGVNVEKISLSNAQFTTWVIRSSRHNLMQKQKKAYVHSYCCRCRRTYNYTYFT